MVVKDWFVNIATGVAAACAVAVTCTYVYRQFVPLPIQVPATANPGRVDRTIPDAEQQIAAGRRIGPPDAAVTLLYYGDFECPVCQRFSMQLEKVRTAHPSEFSIVFRYWPLPYHRQAYPSAKAAECGALQGHFEQMYQTLYSAHDSLGLIPYHELGRRASVPDLRAFDSCTSDPKPVARIQRDQDAALAGGFPGTPSVILNGKLRVERLPTIDELERLITEAKRSLGH